jgi:hypothetical protein
MADGVMVAVDVGEDVGVKDGVTAVSVGEAIDVGVGVTNTVGDTVMVPVITAVAVVSGVPVGVGVIDGSIVSNGMGNIESKGAMTGMPPGWQAVQSVGIAGPRT